MLGKNSTKRKKVFAFVCIVIFVGEAILFMLKATTDYKTYTDSEVVKADVINVSGLSVSIFLHRMPLNLFMNQQCSKIVLRLRLI